IFDESSLEGGAASSMVSAFVGPFRSALASGLSVVGIAGNHDRDWFFDTANAWLGADSSSGQGRVILRTRPDLVTLESGSEGVNFALLPFPTPARYQLGADDAGGVAGRNERLAKRFIEEMETLRDRAAQARLPTVLLAHVTVD